MNFELVKCANISINLNLYNFPNFVVFALLLSTPNATHYSICINWKSFKRSKFFFFFCCFCRLFNFILPDHLATTFLRWYFFMSFPLIRTIHIGKKRRIFYAKYSLLMANELDFNLLIKLIELPGTRENTI